MQQTGTLRKRKKRNLAKVGGLTTAPYDENGDSFDGDNLFGHPVQSSKPDFRTITSGSDTRIRISGFKGFGDRPVGSTSSSGRVTRNPLFHVPFDEEAECSIECDLPKASQSIVGPPSHLLDESTMNRLRQLLILGASSGAFPWYWNKKEYRIEKWSSRFEALWKIQWFIGIIPTVALTCFQFYSFFYRVLGTNKTYREIFINSFSVYWYVWAVCFNVNMYLYKDQIREYINTMLRFNKEHVDQFVVNTEGYKFGGRVLINFCIPTVSTQVLASIAMFLIMPYLPCYVFSYIYPKPWYWLIPGAIQGFLMTGQVVTSYMLTSWIIVAHANSVEFWLRESHNNYDSDYTIDTIRHPNKSIEMYRSLQVLCTCFNDCMSPLAIPLVIMHTITGLIPCGYVLIRSMNQVFIEEFPGILTYPIGVIHCTSTAFAFLSMGAHMYDLAVSFIDSWSCTKQKNLRRILMSCPTLKVKVGHMYFMTASATITFFKVTFDFITDCIITFP